MQVSDGILVEVLGQRMRRDDLHLEGKQGDGVLPAL
jgi:hypothetical protein